MKYILLLLATLVITFASLSYSLYKSTVKAEAALVAARASLVLLESSLIKKEQECRITDEVIAEWQKEKDASAKEKDSDIQRIDKLPIKKPSEVKPNENSAVVDIDAKLPDDLRLLLQQSYNRDKGSASDDP